MVVAVLAVAYGLWLLAQARDGVFFTSDGGLKYLMTAQLADGQLHPDLRLEAPPWIRELWREGLFPIEFPAVYTLGGRTFTLYPAFFPAASAPFLRAFGFRGLLLLPTLGAWLALWVVARASRGLGATGPWSAAALAAVAFASPLLLYGAMFWEHAAGVAVALLGFWLAQESRTAWRAGLGGACLGIATWLRPELVVLAAIAVTFAWAGRGDRPPASRWWLTLGVAAALGAMAAWNLAVYGTPSGAYAGSGTGPADVAVRLRGAATVAATLGRLLLEHFPLVVPLAALALASLLPGRGGPEGAVRRWMLAGLLFLLTVPLVLYGPERHGHGGKQLGPRFLLVAMGLLSVGAAGFLQRLWPALGTARRALLGLVLAVPFAMGVSRNTVQGARELREDYAGRVLPVLERLREGTAPVLVTDHFITMELATLARRRPFVLARTNAQLDRIVRAAARAGVERLTLVGYVGYRLDATWSVASPEGPIHVRAAWRGNLGHYALHDVEVRREGSGAPGDAGGPPPPPR
jgi:hypothetical protein